MNYRVGQPVWVEVQRHEVAAPGWYPGVVVAVSQYRDMYLVDIEGVPYKKEYAEGVHREFGMKYEGPHWRAHKYRLRPRDESERDKVSWDECVWRVRRAER